MGRPNTPRSSGSNVRSSSPIGSGATPSHDAARLRAAGQQAKQGQHAGALTILAKTLDNSASPWFADPARFIQRATSVRNGLENIRGAAAELAFTKAAEVWRNRQAEAAARGDMAGTDAANVAARQMEQRAANLRATRRQASRKNGGAPSTGRGVSSPDFGATSRVNPFASGLLDDAAARAQRAKIRAAH